MDSLDANYDPHATFDNNTQCSSYLQSACLDTNAENYNSKALQHDPNDCAYFGCADTSALNFAPAISNARPYRMILICTRAPGHISNA